LRRWLIHYSELSAKRLTGTRRKGRVLVGIIVAASALGSMLAATRYTNRTLLAQAQARRWSWWWASALSTCWAGWSWVRGSTAPRAD
jgi:hypothetical protein